MVPSWTETLIAAGVEVVGRTKFCIHPAEHVRSIPIVGGTKQVNWERVETLKPDLLLLDQEENTRAMADRAPTRWVATHVRSIADVSRELMRIAVEFEHPYGLLNLAERWQRVARMAPPARDSLQPLPGVLDWVVKPTAHTDRFVYLIWHNPWMAVGPRTFIGSVFRRLGFASFQQPMDEAYPVVDLQRFDVRRTALLFSSEPFPFARRPGLMRDCGFSAALVDGEAFSWFGVRSLRFLERCLEQDS